MSDFLWPHWLKHSRLLCPPLSLRVCSDSCPLSWWCCLTISPSAASFSSCPQSFPTSVFSSELALWIRWSKYWSFSFSIVLPMNIQGWFPLGFTGLISLQSKGLSRAFSSTTIRKHQSFGAFNILQLNSGSWWQGGLACCDSWGRKESDTTERLIWSDLS